MLNDGFLIDFGAFNAAATSPAPVGLPAPVSASEPSRSMPTPSGVLEHEVEQLAEALSVKFEELDLIHQLSEQLDLEKDSETICRALLEQLATCIRSRLLVIQLDADEDSGIEARRFVSGQTDLIESLTGAATRCCHDSLGFQSSGVAVLNDPGVDATVQFRTVVVAIQRQGQVLGRMIAARELDDQEFGTVECELMKSTSMMLGVHLINQRQYAAIQEMFAGTIQSLVSALDAKDAYTCGHSSRVADLAVELAGRMGLAEEDIRRIHMAGMLHDIGKIGVQDSVLCKPGKLTEEEFEQIKQHPVLGYEILKGIHSFRNILPAVRHHHESWDGRGYPDGLAGDAIPRDAQVLAVADAFDAMTSDRPYRSGMPLEKVVEIFREGRGKQWAADVVDVLLASPDVMRAYTHREPVEST